MPARHAHWGVQVSPSAVPSPGRASSEERSGALSGSPLAPAERLPRCRLRPVTSPRPGGCRKGAAGAGRPTSSPCPTARGEERRTRTGAASRAGVRPAASCPSSRSSGLLQHGAVVEVPEPGLTRPAQPSARQDSCRHAGTPCGRPDATGPRHGSAPQVQTHARFETRGEQAPHDARDRLHHDARGHAGPPPGESRPCLHSEGGRASRGTVRATDPCEAVPAAQGGRFRRVSSPGRRPEWLCSGSRGR
jgi:hypothetical protein